MYLIKLYNDRPDTVLAPGQVDNIIMFLFAGPPVISPAPDSLELVVPFHQNMHIMDCPYIANPAATVRWLKEDQALISGRGKYIVHDNGTLLISDLTLEDGGSYRCVLANTMGVAEATYNLLVIGKH